VDALDAAVSQHGLLWRIGLSVRRFMLRTQAGPLRPLWSLLYELFLKTVAAWLRRDVDAVVYVGGTFGHGDPIFGVSDVDLIVVVPSDRDRPGQNRLRVKERWRALCARFGPVAWVVSAVAVYEDTELREAVSSTCFTYGLDSRTASVHAVFVEPRVADDGGLLTRPGLWPTREWRLLAGRDLRWVEPAIDVDRRRLNAWLELQFWWRFAFEACLAPDAPDVPYLCVKLVAEPARMLLWLTHGEQAFERRKVLERAIELLPEEEPTLRRAIELHEELHRSPTARLDEFLPCFVRLSSRAAQTIADEIAAAGTTEVRLVGAADEPLLPEVTVAELLGAAASGRRSRLLPLADWRARTRPLPGDEALVLVQGNPGDPGQLAAAARSYRPAVHPALRADGLLVLPVPSNGPRQLRCVQCAASDPVSFALADDLTAAMFPRVPGWSAIDSARRAVAEHRAWLDSVSGRFGVEEQAGHTATLAMLLSAARAACFLESLQDGEPQLALTLAAAAESLARRDRSIAEEGYVALGEAHLERQRVPQSTVKALARLVTSLPAYAAET
jgi:hypothetical protein